MEGTTKYVHLPHRGGTFVPRSFRTALTMSIAMKGENWAAKSVS